MKLLHIIAIIICTSFSLSAQKAKPKIKFGDVSVQDFNPTIYAIDSSANAIVLADIGSSEFQGNARGNFSLVFDQIKRIRILNKNGFNQADVEIPLYIDGSDEELLQNFEAATYNIENGKIITTKLDNSGLFKNQYDAHHILRKFTFPNIKEGSIIEYKYTIVSPFFFNLQPWNFQGSIPRLWSEYSTTVPVSIFEYVSLRKGFLPYTLDTSSTSFEQYNISVPGDGMHSSQILSVRSSTITSRWAIQNVPALKEENFITAIDNYRSGIQFQLKKIKYSDTYDEDILGNWSELADKLMKREDFGLSLNDNNGWLKDALKQCTAGVGTNLERAKKIYEYIRDNYTCTSEEGKYLSKSLKKVFQDKNGNVADINLLLAAAMKLEGFGAQPAILSTRENGEATALYPLINQYNYVICRVNVNDTFYVLDATNKMFGFGKLPENLYNGFARIIDQAPELIILSADSLKESKFTTVFISNDDSSSNINASFSSQLGYFESNHMRQDLTKNDIDKYFKQVKKSYSFDPHLSNEEIDSLKIYDEPVTVKYDLKFELGDNDDIIYFNPLLGEAYKQNPFKAEERNYPVEMPSCSDETYILNMEIPKGYKIDELPKSARVKLNEDEGLFEYIIAGDDERIQLRCRIKINKANFNVDDYQTLREFFAYIVKKQAEQIVFKKIK